MDGLRPLWSAFISLSDFNGYSCPTAWSTVFSQTEEARDVLQTYKGGFYVIVTGLILLGLVRASVRRTKRIDEARIATLERYDELVENANDAIFTLDIDGNFTAVNRAVSSVTGYSANELLSMRFEQVLADEHVDYITQLLDPQNTQNPSSIRDVIKCKDGRTGFLEISSRPLSLKDDRASIENIARDVTLRHRMQAELEQAKLRYQRLIETANEGIWTVDANFRVTLVNKKICEITGFAEADVLGRDLSKCSTRDCSRAFPVIFRMSWQTRVNISTLNSQGPTARRSGF